MKTKLWFATLLVVLTVPALVMGQLKSADKPTDFSKLLTTAPQGLIGAIGLDPSRFSMHQSYSLSYLSAGGQGFSQGVYLNTMGYRIADPLYFSLQWGVMNQPLGSFGVPGLYNNGFFLSGAELQYKPSRNVSLGIQFNSVPAGYYYYPYRDRNTYFLAPPEEQQ